MNDDPTKNAREPHAPSAPSEASLEELPEIDEHRVRRRPGRGHHRHRSTGEIVVVTADLWSRFGSAAAVDEALRRFVEAEEAARS